MSQNSIDKKRMNILSWMGVGLFAAAGVSQARVQLFQRDDILKRATKTDRFIVARPEIARRGGILDHEGKPLAQDEDTRFLTVCFGKTPKSPAFYLDLAAATGIPASEFATMASSKAPVDWKKPIGAAQVSAVLDVKQKWRADGVGLSRSGRRSYPLGEAAAGFLGAMRDKTPLSGIELGQNKTLAGMDGKIVGIVDREGNYLPMRLDKQTVRRKDGATLTLSIDSELQQVAAEAVKHTVDANKADHGVAIVMNPKTGDILAMANWPSFDPNRAIEPNKTGKTPEFNEAYMAALEPGSTFKVLTLAKALDEGVVLPDETYYCRGTMVVGKRTIGCDREHGSHGLVNTEGAIARSCNLAAANWALRVGHDDFVKYMEQLGLMDKPGLGLPQESRGLYNYKEYATQLQLANNGFGQAMNYTPLALCSAFAMLGNEGKRVYPRLITKIDDKEVAVHEGGKVLGSESCQSVLHMMRAVFESEHGTGRTLRISGYELGGKTGTAQKTNFTTRSMQGGGHVSNFLGFVPAENPKAVILVMVDNPKAGKIYGAAVAGPVFKSIAQSVIRRLHVARADGRDAESEVITERISGPRVAPEPDPILEPKAEPKKAKAPQIEVSAKRITRQESRTTETPQSRPRKIEQPSMPTKRIREASREDEARPVVRKTTKPKGESSKRPITKSPAEEPRTERKSTPKLPIRTPSKESDVSTRRASKKGTESKTASRTIRIIEPVASKRTTTRTAKKAPSKAEAERPADIQTRRRSAVRLEGGLAPKLGGTHSSSKTPVRKTEVQKPYQRRVTRVAKPDQSPVSKKRVNRDR